jgi:hypothetical protein
VDRVVRLELDGGTYREAAEIKPSIEGPSSASIAVTATPRIAADPVREEIYVKLGNIPARFDGKTGAHHPDFAKKLKGNAPRGIEDFDVGPDGLLYARAGGRAYGPFIARYGRDGSPVPFPEENSVLWNNMRVIYTGVKGTSNVQQKGFDVAPDGRIYVHASELAGGWTYMHFDGEGNIVSVPASKVEPHVKLFTAWQSKDSLGLTPTKPRGWGKGRGSLIEVYDRDGKEISINALLSTGYGHGLRADRDGNIYRGFRDARPKIGAGLVKGKFAVTGRMAKFGFNGEYPVGSEEGGSGKPKDALWTFDGTTTSGAGSTCTCHAGRFDLDGFARAFVPSMHLYSIVVLDANGNRIARLGRYGNADCRGGESPVPEPDIGLCWVRAVAASDRALYALDSGNQRVLKAALTYQAEETIALP